MFTRQNLLKIVFLFLATYPIFDMEPFYNSFTTLFRIIIVLGFFVWLLCLSKEARQKSKYIIIYILFVLLYTIFHHINALHFTSLVPNNFNYSFLKEFLYIIKMSMPLLFFYLLFFLQMDKQQYIKIIKFWIIIIGGSIIVSNIFTISLGSYSGEFIKGNILEWFSTDLTYYDLASKGFFMYANQVSAILVCLLPIVYYLYLKKEVSFPYLLMIMSSLLMLGTRVANIGGIAIFFLVISISLFFKFMKKFTVPINRLLYSLVLIIICGLILPFSPTMNRHKIFDFILYNQPKLATVSDYDSLEYIKNHYKEKEIADIFILERYPYIYDTEFWLSFMELERNKRVDYRYLETSIIKRVVSINQNPYDRWLGITNTRIQNIFNIERDYILQYYAFGILGSILFLSVYIFIFGFGFIKTIKKISIFNVLVYLSFALFLIIAYMTGNLFNQLSVPLMILFLVSMLFQKESVFNEKALFEK